MDPCMHSTLQSRLFSVLICIFILLMFCTRPSHSTDTDVYCLKTLKDSLEDPFHYLKSWNFDNRTDGFICGFIGVECWHPSEDRVLNIRLLDMGLKGLFPNSLRNCSTMTGLDLSGNKLFGNIPSDICDSLKFVTSLDLSSNNISGEIPVNLSDCTYLNLLKLNDNRLTGQIPPQLYLLSRLTTFSVANNLLTGRIPNFHNFEPSSYANNQGLCGSPLQSCQVSSNESHIKVIAGAAIGGITVAAAFVLIVLVFLGRVTKKNVEDLEENKWAMSIKGAKGIKVSMFGDFVMKMRLSDLMKATNNFSKHNIICSGSTGTMYRALLEGGTLFIVKRLHDSQHSEKEFSSEMVTLGSVNHRNLLTLVGFCVAKKEKLLVYNHMPNGSLHDALHATDVEMKAMDWYLRLKIGIGTARGLAWLHHTCKPRIIHRNLSSKCIYLDSEFEPKISDFGLARLMNPVDTHLSTFVKGEFGDLGYVAPEYARTLVATPKGDIYSFGTVLLELVTGERPTHVSKAPDGFKGSLVEWVEHLSENSGLCDAVDVSLVGNGFESEILQFLKVACNCVVSNPKERPSMFEVYQLLRAIGHRYDFSADDDILMASDSGDADLKELIVSYQA